MSENGKINSITKVNSMKKTFKKFENEIYSYVHEKDIRTSCYGVFVDQLDYFTSLIPTILKSENKKHWGGRIAKQTYISILSTIEYAMNKIIEKYPRSKLYHKVMKCRKNNGHSFRKLVCLSAELGLLSRTLKRDFENIIDIRNLLVHNNSISDRTCIKMIGDISIEMKKGEPISIKPTELLQIILTVVEIFHRWNIELAKNYGIAKR